MSLVIWKSSEVVHYVEDFCPLLCDQPQKNSADKSFWMAAHDLEELQVSMKLQHQNICFQKDAAELLLVFPLLDLQENCCSYPHHGHQRCNLNDSSHCPNLFGGFDFDVCLPVACQFPFHIPLPR